MNTKEINLFPCPKCKSEAETYYPLGIGYPFYGCSKCNKCWPNPLRWNLYATDKRIFKSPLMLMMFGMILLLTIASVSLILTVVGLLWTLIQMN